MASWEPSNWNIIWTNIVKMRSSRTAVIDTMGCERLADVTQEPSIVRFQTLVALMLSSQTNDRITAAAMDRLKSNYCGTVKGILSKSDDELGQLIYPVGFWKKKVSYLKETCKILESEYNCDIPNDIENLIKLPGVGPKMANIAMSVCWDVTCGIAVDTHVHRIANRLRWVRKPTKYPTQTQEELEAWVPRHLWRQFNYELVGFGQERCSAKKPACSECLNRDICPASEAKPRRAQKRTGGVADDTTMYESSLNDSSSEPSAEVFTTDTRSVVENDGGGVVGSLQPTTQRRLRPR